MTTTNTKSPEEVALELTNIVFRAEGKHLYNEKASDFGTAKTAESRDSILNTYAECLKAVKGERLYELEPEDKEILRRVGIEA